MANGLLDDICVAAWASIKHGGWPADRLKLPAYSGPAPSGSPNANKIR